MDAPTFDPSAPLPAPPDPWTPSEMPSARPGPPYHMTDMIAAEPALARRILARLAGAESPAARLAGAVRAAAAAGEPIVVTGCGTSEHAAFGVADILRDALRSAGLPAGPTSVIAAQAFEMSLDPQAGGLHIAISHEGGSAATNASIEAAARAGAATALITAGSASPGAALAELVVTTDEMDQSWCHTIGYVAPLVAATAVGAHLAGRPTADAAVERALADGARDEGAAETIASALAGAQHLIAIGSGVDRTGAREFVLKVEEAAWMPSAMRDLETFLHGHLPATGGSTALLLFLTDRAHEDERLARARQALAATRVLGLRAAAVVSADADAGLDPALTPAGRIVLQDDPSLPGAVASLLGTATALQLITERLARARGTNPDPIRRDDSRYRQASAATES